MDNCNSNHTFENWAHTLRFKPAQFCQPESEADVIAIVKDALAKGGTVRTQGAGHTWANFVVTDGTLVQLDKMNKGVSADVLHHRYTVQAGIRIRDLIENLAADGLAMRNLGSITAQSIAGAISTGTHGTGLGIGNLSSMIVGMRLVTGTGDVLTIKESDTDLLDAARVSVGLLGIITEVTIDCLPLYDLDYDAYFCKFDDVVENLDTLTQENERFLVWWLAAPIGPRDNVIVVTNNRPGTPPGMLGGVAGQPGGATPGDALAMDTSDLLSLISSLVPSGPFHPILRRKGRYDRMLTLPLLPVFHRECEYALPVEQASAAFKELKRVFDECEVSTTLPVEVRFVAKDNTLLSPARGRDTCYIGINTEPNANEANARAEPIFKEFGGRPHWGKHFTLRRSELEAMYPDSYDKFRQIRKQLDPKGVFTNTLVRQLFE